MSGIGMKIQKYRANARGLFMERRLWRAIAACPPAIEVRFSRDDG